MCVYVCISLSPRKLLRHTFMCATFFTPEPICHIYFCLYAYNLHRLFAIHAHTDCRFCQTLATLCDPNFRKPNKSEKAAEAPTITKTWPPNCESFDNVNNQMEKWNWLQSALRSHKKQKENSCTGLLLACCCCCYNLCEMKGNFGRSILLLKYNKLPMVIYPLLFHGM